MNTGVPSYVLLAVASVGVAVYAGRRPRVQLRFVDACDPTRRHLLRGPVLHRYLGEGGPGGALGPPVSGLRRAVACPTTPLGADREVVFANGAIYLNSEAGRTKVLLWDTAVEPHHGHT